MSVWPDDVTLSGTHARLEMLHPDHGLDLAEAAADGDLHKLWYTWIPEPSGVAKEIEKRLSERAAGRMLPFAVIDAVTGKAVGMTTFMHINADQKRVEIGSTWNRASAQRTPINSECKLMMLTHAFETLGCIAVEFRTHYINVQSRRAIERLGAKLDGVLRSHMVLPNGTVRDTAVYSIIPNEWPSVKANLEFRLGR
jgi:RimJ/RimL family protein N-acetyltransferase